MKMALPSTMRVQNQARDGRAKDGQREITRTGRVGRVDRLVVAGGAASDLGGAGVAAARHALRATANAGLDPQAPRVDVSHQTGAGGQAAAMGRATAESRGKEGVDRRRWRVCQASVPAGGAA